MKRKKAICKPWGVLTPIEEVAWWILAQQEEALCWLFESCGECLTDAYGGLLVMAIRLRLLGAWQARWWGFMMVLGMKAAQKYVKKKYMNKWGDLGIEPRSQYLQDSTPTSWANALSWYHNRTWLLYVNNEYYAGQLKKRAKLWMVQPQFNTSASPSLFLRFAWK